MCRNRVCTFFFLVVLLLMGVTVTLSEHNDTENTPELIGENLRHTSTWLSCEITDDIVTWLVDLHFTDVALRAWSRETDFPAATKILAAVNITLWGVWGFYSSYSGPTDEEGLTELLHDYVARVPNGHVYLDDCHELRHWHGDQALINLLNAVRAVQTIDANNESNILTCFYWDGSASFPWTSFNLTNIDADFYTETTTADYANMPDVDTNSMGGCIWAWRTGWTGLSPQVVTDQFAIMGERGFKRVIDWSGYEIDYYPDYRMQRADLYNNPAWWELIAQLNAQFLRGVDE